MGRRRKLQDTYSELAESRTEPPALSPEDREQQMIAKAERLAERQLEEGTASSQVICHYLKLATTREQLEKEILRKKEELMTAQTEALKAAQRVEALFNDAAAMFRKYSGNLNDEEL